jgi:autotransporter translocation and assembly factor TamB
VGAVSGWPLVVGAADVEVTLAGPLLHPHGQVAIALPKLSVHGDVYTDGLMKVALTDEGARVQELTLARARGGSVSGRGTIGWSGELALDLYPRDFPLAAIPWLQSVPVPIAGTLSGDLSLGGTVDRPVPGGILSLLAFKVRDAFLGKGTLKLDPGSDAIHINGDFFGNVHVDGYITLVPKLSVVASIRFKDLALERFYPEIQKLAEVHGLASGEAAITIDSESGLTFAKLTLDQLTLTLASVDENGRPQRLVVKNPPDRPVLLTTDGKSLDIKRADLYSAIGEFKMKGTVGQRCNVYMVGRIGLELLEYFFRGLFEHTHGPANVELTIAGDLARPEVTGSVQIGGGKGAAELVPRGLEGKLTLRVPSGRVDITPQSIRLSQVVVSTDKDKLAQASGEVVLNDWVPGAVRGQITGDLSPKLFQWPLNAYVADASGRMHVDVRLGGVWSHPQWRGTAEVKDVRFRVRRVERELRIDGGTIAFDNFDVAIGCPRSGQKPAGCRSLSGMIDEESKIDGVDGRISIGDEWTLRRVDVWLDGHEIRYAQPGWAISFSPRVELFGDGNQLQLRGNIDLVEGRYSQNFDLVSMVFHPRVVEQSEPFWQGMPLVETMRLSVHVQSTGSLLVKDNVAELSLGAVLDIAGTLSEPRFAGIINIDEGGRLSPPGFRYSFDTQRGTVRFDEDKKIPDQTPTIDLNATAPYIDKYEQQHTLTMRLSGTALSPRLELGSLEGWDPTTVLVIVFGGQSPEDIRRAVSGTSSTSSQTTGSATDNVAKTLSGATVGQFISDPLKRVTGFDTVNVEFGGSSFDVKLCKRFGRYFKTCGQGELGFAGSSRFGGSVELKLSDRPFEWSGVGRYEYLTHGVETLQDTLNSGGGELRLRVPLGY